MPKSNDKLLNEIMARRRALQNVPKQEACWRACSTI